MAAYRFFPTIGKMPPLRGEALCRNAVASKHWKNIYTLFPNIGKRICAATQLLPNIGKRNYATT